MTHYHHLVEIGAGDHHSSDALGMLSRGEVTADLVTLYEPNAILCADLRRPNTLGDKAIMWPVAGRIIEAAVGDRGMWPLIHLGYASYLRETPSFYATSIEADGHRYVEALCRGVPLVPMDEAVTPDVDGLILTINGGEDRLLGAMTARPKTIYTKHYVHSPRQWNETHRVWEWMQRNRYTGRTLASNQHGTYHSVIWRLTDSVNSPSIVS